MVILREQFTIAVERRKVEKAKEILGELAHLEPSDPDIPDMHLKVTQLERERRRDITQARQNPLFQSSEMRSNPPVVDRRAINELLEKAEWCYQHENYGGALDALSALDKLDPTNSDAARLKGDVERARALATQIAEEDALARGAQNKASGKSDLPHKSSGRKSDDYWGTSVKAAESLGLEELPDQSPAAKVIQKPVIPLAVRVVNALEKSKSAIATGIIIVFCAGLLVAGYLLIRKLKSTVIPARASLLVLPAVTAGSDSGLSLIGDGLVDDFIRKLGMVTDIRVVAPYSAFSVGSSSTNPQQAARIVSAGFCVRWTLSAIGGSIVIDQSIVDTVSSNPILTKHLEIPMRELASQRADLLQSILGVTGVRPSEEEQVALNKFPTPDQFAFQSYLVGRGMLRRPGMYPPSRAIDSFNRALAADSLFAEAYSALGWAHILAFESGDTSSNHIAEAAMCVQHAITVGLRNAETFRVWGAVEAGYHQYDKAIERFEQAVSFAPSDAEARRRIALVQVIRGEADQALGSAQYALRDDPLNADSYVIMSLVQQFEAVTSGDSKEGYEDALHTLEDGHRYALDRSAYDSKYLAEVYWYVQDPDRALAILVDHVARNRQSYEALYLLGRVQQAAGRSSQEWHDALVRAQDILDQELKLKPEDGVLYSWLALVHTRLGAFKDAVAASQHALQFGSDKPEVLYNVSRMYSLQRDVKQALTYLRKAVDREYDLAAVLDMDLFNLHSNPDYLKSVIRQ